MKSWKRSDEIKRLAALAGESLGIYVKPESMDRMLMAACSRAGCAQVVHLGGNTWHGYTIDVSRADEVVAVGRGKSPVSAWEAACEAAGPEIWGLLDPQPEEKAGAGAMTMEDAVEIVLELAAECSIDEDKVAPDGGQELLDMAREQAEALEVAEDLPGCIEALEIISTMGEVITMARKALERCEADEHPAAAAVFGAVMVTVSGGIIGRVEFFRTPAEGIKALEGFVRDMNPERDDVGLYNGSGELVANAKDFLDDGENFVENPDLLKAFGITGKES